jgi:hypothetical protein
MFNTKVVNRLRAGLIIGSLPKVPFVPMDIVEVNLFSEVFHFERAISKGRGESEPGQ